MVATCPPARPLGVTPDALDAVVTFIATQQSRPERNVTYLGTDRAAIRAELDDLHPAWATTVRVVYDESGSISGVVLVEWDDEVGRAWVHGPWVAGDDTAWQRWARPLYDAAAEQVPPAVTDLELSGDVANTGLAALADELGWSPTETNYAYALRADVAAGWPEVVTDGVRAVLDADLDAIRQLHDSEFPATYWSAEQLVERAHAGAQTVLVIDDPTGQVAGYAAGRVQPDGEGYIDFLAVDEATRGRGGGRRLVVELATRLLVESSNGRVCLTVQEHRAPARGLYTALGFTLEAAFRGYRSS